MKAETVVEMLTRTAAHYPNSGHTAQTLKIVAEDWFYTFNGKMTDRAFIEAITIARRQGKFFPSEADVLAAIGAEGAHSCKGCGYYDSGMCANLKKEGFDPDKCGSYLPKTHHQGHA